MKDLLDRSAPVALYYQVAKILEQQIVEGIYKPEDYFGTEQELQERFEVSRATIRKALELLEANDLVFRVTGKGIFVASSKLKVDLPNLLSFSEEMRKRGMQPGTQLLDVETVEASHAVHEALDLPASHKALVVRRIRLGDEQPIVFSESYIPIQLGLTEDDDFKGSLYELIQTKSGMAVDSARHTIEGALATGEIATYLHVDEGFPVLRFRRIGYDASGRPIVYETGMARADKYSYEIQLKRSLV